jgi:hypothetical protein
LTLRDEHRLRVFENRELRKIFGLTRDEENCVMRSFKIILFSEYKWDDEVKENEMGRAYSTNRGKRLMHVGYGRENQKKGDH